MALSFYASFTPFIIEKEDLYMYNTKLNFERVNKSVFDGISDQVKLGTPYYATVVVKYNGSNLYGDMSIEIAGSDADIIIGVLDIVKNNIQKETES